MPEQQPKRKYMWKRLTELRDLIGTLRDSVPQIDTHGKIGEEWIEDAQRAIVRMIRIYIMGLRNSRRVEEEVQIDIGELHDMLRWWDEDPEDLDYGNRNVNTPAPE